jgi:hypothetical protein
MTVYLSDRRASRRRPRWERLLASIPVVIGLAACGAGRDAMGTNAGPCFAALPVAKHAVHGRGSLAGVELADVATLSDRNQRQIHDLLKRLPAAPDRNLCLVGYAGSFTPEQVEHPVGPAPNGGVGRYAIVVVAATTSKPKLLATFVLRHAPPNFGGVHGRF